MSVQSLPGAPLTLALHCTQHSAECTQYSEQSAVHCTPYSELCSALSVLTSEWVNVCTLHKVHSSEWASIESLLENW